MARKKKKTVSSTSPKGKRRGVYVMMDLIQQNVVMEHYKHKEWEV